MENSVPRYKLVALRPEVFDKLAKLGDLTDTPSKVINRLIDFYAAREQSHVA
jgi:hypothetical protein